MIASHKNCVYRVTYDVWDLLTNRRIKEGSLEVEAYDLTGAIRHAQGREKELGLAGQVVQFMEAFVVKRL